MPNKLFSALLSHTKRLPASNLITLGRIKHWEPSVCTNFWLAPSNRKWEQFKLNLILVASFSALSVWIHKYIFVQEKHQITWFRSILSLQNDYLVGWALGQAVWIYDYYFSSENKLNYCMENNIKATNLARLLYRAAINTKLICHVDWDIIRNPPYLTVSLLHWKS